MKMPSFQFYPADWRKDPAVQALDYETRGVWFEMLCLMHESEERGVLLLNGVAMPQNAMARLLGLDNQTLTTHITKLIEYGVARRRDSDGALFNKRMVADEKLCQIRRNAGKLGGNPALLNQKETTKVKQNPTPSSSASSSPSPSGVKSTPLPPEGDLPLPFSSVEFQEAWSDWVAHRGEKRKKLTPRSISGLFKKFKGWGESKSIAAIAESVSQGYTGCFPPKDFEEPNTLGDIPPFVVEYPPLPDDCDPLKIMLKRIAREEAREQFMSEPHTEEERAAYGA